MEDCKPINTTVECGIKLSKNDKEEKVDLTLYKSLVGSLRYLTCTRPDILYATGLVRRYIENPTTTHFKVAKRILRYLKGTIDYGLLYSATNDYMLVGYSDSDWAGDTDDRKSTSGYVFYMGDTAFTWMSKKQPIVTLSTREAVYVAATFNFCHAIWLRSLLSELEWPQRSQQLFVWITSRPLRYPKIQCSTTEANTSTPATTTSENALQIRRFKFEYVKSQDQVADIFTKPLKHEDFIKIRTLLGMTNQV
ncbi:secreted RxLR effector protein 161-like [Salvia splendens]|uniref:secreted RxLR effector protein 161-like n=1 Tax=Salvia splendens TaxID=180675 RepID=UPI001C27A589|nr:secreted RxLR effector protein 161-like [Salvia splendens]